MSQSLQMQPHGDVVLNIGHVSLMKKLFLFNPQWMETV